FKYVCQARRDKLQKDSIMYAALCKVVRERGFKVALIARYSHCYSLFSVTTAIFSACGTGIYAFMLGAVYIGVM
ncbi:hypothetical protein F4604DRAFT_1589804, partial [Suillus subluteus]